jgi:micrococcal nuclease
MKKSKINKAVIFAVQMGIVMLLITASNNVDVYRVNTAGIRSYKEADVSKMLAGYVVKCADGDTVRVEFEKQHLRIKKTESIRMIGVDTPETVHPNKGVEYFGKEASEYTKQKLLGKRVYLAFDKNLRDKYKRLLAYIYTAEGECHNANLIREGYSPAYTAFPFQFSEEFKLLEEQAQKNKIGLWNVLKKNQKKQDESSY